MNKSSLFFLFLSALLCSILLYGCSSQTNHGTEKQAKVLLSPAPPDIEHSIPSSTDKDMKPLVEE